MPARALVLLEEASGAAEEDSLRSRAEHLRGLTMIWTGGAETAADLLVVEAERAVPRDPQHAAAMFADAAAACAALGQCHRTLALAERAAALLGDGGDPPTRAHVLAVLSWGLVLRGQTRRARPVLNEVERLAAAIDPLSPAA